MRTAKLLVSFKRDPGLFLAGSGAGLGRQLLEHTWSRLTLTVCGAVCRYPVVPRSWRIDRTGSNPLHVLCDHSQSLRKKQNAQKLTFEIGMPVSVSPYGRRRSLRVTRSLSPPHHTCHGLFGFNNEFQGAVMASRLDLPKLQASTQGPPTHGYSRKVQQRVSMPPSGKSQAFTHNKVRARWHRLRGLIQP